MTRRDSRRIVLCVLVTLVGALLPTCADAPPVGVDAQAVLAPRAPDPERIENAAPETAARPRHFDPRVLSAVLDTTPRNGWVTSDGIAIASDFTRDVVERSLGADLIDATAALREIFGAVDLSRLSILIHGDAVHSVAGVPVNAVHRDGEVHLFAGAAAELSADAGAHLRHELVHAFLFLANRPAPRWLDEGLAQALSTLVRTADGDFEPLPRSDFVAVFGRLRERDRTPRLLELLDSTLDYPDPARLGAFYIASWSFTYFCLRNGAGPLRTRVDALLRATRVELMALGPGWLSDPATSDPVAAWLPHACSEERAEADLGEHALAELTQLPNWLAAIETLANAHPIARARAARLLSLAPVEPAAFTLARSLASDVDPAVRRSIARSVFTNDAWVLSGRTELEGLAVEPTMLAPATLALALGGDANSLGRWFDLAESIPREEAIDALLALKRVLPPAAPGLDTHTLLATDFDVRATLNEISAYVGDSSRALEFDATSTRYVEREAVPAR